MAALLVRLFCVQSCRLNTEGEARAESGGESSRQAGGNWQPDAAPGLVLSTLYLAMEWLLQAAPANRLTFYLACIRRQLQHVVDVLGPHTLSVLARTQGPFAVASMLLMSARDTLYIGKSSVPCSCQRSAVGHRPRQLMIILKHRLG